MSGINSTLDVGCSLSLEEHQNKKLHRQQLSKAWRAANLDKRHAIDKRYRERNKILVAQRLKTYYLQNRDKLRQKAKEYRLKNLEAIKLKLREYHKRTYPLKREIIIAKTKEYAKSHPEIRRKCHDNWIKRHPDKYRAANKAASQKYKAQKRGADVGDKHINSVIRSWKLEPNFVCYHCGKRFPSTVLQIDHVIPMSKGGKHTVSNICKSCWLCNIRKRDKILFLI